jgi:hypothetical protein
MEYMIVSGANGSKFINQVNNKLQEGWILQGGICVTGTSRTINEYYQAMYRNKT